MKQTTDKIKNENLLSFGNELSKNELKQIFGGVTVFGSAPWEVVFQIRIAPGGIPAVRHIACEPVGELILVAHRSKVSQADEKLPVAICRIHHFSYRSK